MAKLGLSAPWDIFYSEINALFSGDPDVHVVYDAENYTIKIYVDRQCKANALGKIIPADRKFGNVVVKLEVVPSMWSANQDCEIEGNLFEIAFNGNDIVSFIKTVKWLGDGEVTYVVFQNEVIQYFSDNIGDFYGVCSTLAQEIAKDVFRDIQGVFFCTDLPMDEDEEFRDEPVAEWP